MKIRGTRALTLLVAGALALTACGGDEESGGGTDPAEGSTDDGNGATEGGGEEASAGVDCTAIEELVSATADMSAEERTAFLVEKANEAGGVASLYTELNARDTAELTDMFEDAYDMDLNVYRAGSEDVRLRLLEEASAGFRGADLIEIEALDMTILEKEGIIGPASSPHREGIIDAGVFDKFTADRVTYIVPVWNPDLIAEGDIPQSLEDLADARFEGLMALEDSDVYWFAAIVKDMMENQGMSEEEAVQVFKDIAANASITSGHTTTLELLIAGQYGVTPNGYSHRVEEFKEEGAPLEWLPVNAPVVAEITAVGVVCNAANPAGALLLEDFFLSPEQGQSFFVSVQRTPGNAELQAESFGPGGDDIEPIRADVAEIVAEYEKWTTLWDSVVRAAGS